MPLLYALTLFVGAVLLFAVQPMVGRMLLPMLGGSPAVWNTCLVFFQAVLLLGYLYCHLSTRYLGRRTQVVVHFALLLSVNFVLPIRVGGTEPPDEAPVLWLLATLLVMVGLPFFAVTTTSPLLQRWYSLTRARGSADPYFLSVASNVGCLAALLAYPFIFEPALRLDEQSNWWRWGYVGYVVLMASCAALGLSRGAALPERLAEGPTDRPGPSTTTKLRWLALAFVPSSLLIGVSNSITTDIAPIPLLWVLPLSIYLATFIVAFAPGVRLPLGRLGKLLAMCVLFLTLALLAQATEPLWLVLVLHLVTFFAAALFCHGRLAAERPPPAHLTGFYLWIALGGVLGGAFNSLLAPVVFQHIGYAEYPLMIVVVCLLRPQASERWNWCDIVAPLLLGLLTLGLISVARWRSAEQWIAELTEATAIGPDLVRRAACFGVPLVLAFFFVERPVRFALGIAALFLAGLAYEGGQGRVLHRERNFLGVVKITVSPDGEMTRLVHGNTVHGQQRRTVRPQFAASYLHTLGAANCLNQASIVAVGDGRWDERRRPLTYYYPTGPAGVTFRYLVDGWRGPRRIGAVGLGTGAIASYARPNQDWTFFELDPAVERLARDERYFTYLRDSSAGALRVVTGDARLKIAKEPDGAFDLLVLDAFSSDAIPLHLLTAEAFALYERKLAPRGVILMHLSNRYLDLAPVVAKIAETAVPPLVVRENNDFGMTERETDDGKFPSVWVVVARNDEDFGSLRAPIRGFAVVSPSTAPRWTDDRADLLRALRKNED